MNRTNIHEDITYHPTRLQGKTCPQVLHDYIKNLLHFNSLGCKREGSYRYGEMIVSTLSISQPLDYTQK